MEKPELTMDIFRSFCLNIGQVMFQANVLTGLFFFLAIAWESRRKALYALLGALIPMLAIPFVPETVWREGLLGYNAVLCAIYWAGTTERRLLYAVVSVVLSVGVELLALYAGLIPLTAPFVLSVWEWRKCSNGERVASQTFNA